MGRRVSAQSAQLQIAVILDEMHYPNQEPEEQYDLLLLAIAFGPVSRRLLDDVPNPNRKGRSLLRDTLTLRTIAPISREMVDEIYSKVVESVTVEMEIERFESDWNSRPEYVDILTPATVVLSVDALGRLIANATFHDSWPLDAVKEVYKKQLEGTVAVPHNERRLIQLLFELSPKLHSEFRCWSGAAISAISHPSIDTWVGERNGHRRMCPATAMTTTAQRRSVLIRALTCENTLFNTDDLRVLFGKELENEIDSKTKGSKYIEAKHETISSLIEESHVRPFERGYFLAQDVTQILVPFAVNNRTEDRYRNLKDDMIHAGIVVPDQPAVVRS